LAVTKENSMGLSSFTSTQRSLESDINYGSALRAFKVTEIGTIESKACMRLSITWWAKKNGLFFHITTLQRLMIEKACNMSNVSEFCLE